MEDIKNIIASMISVALDNKIDKSDIISKIEIPKDKKNGDFAYPCFNLAKILRNSPVNIANELKEKIVLPEEISKVEVVNGYLNFYINDLDISKKVLVKIINEKDIYGFQNIGNNANVCIDYSSPNIAKPFNLGHFRTTIIGRAISNLYKELGYNTISINYLNSFNVPLMYTNRQFNNYKSRLLKSKHLEHEFFGA